MDDIHQLWPVEGLTPREAARRLSGPDLFEELLAAERRHAEVHRKRGAVLLWSIEHGTNRAAQEDRRLRRDSEWSWSVAHAAVRRPLIEALADGRVAAVGVFDATGTRQRIMPERFRDTNFTLNMATGVAKEPVYRSVVIFPSAQMADSYILPDRNVALLPHTVAPAGGGSTEPPQRPIFANALTAIAWCFEMDPFLSTLNWFEENKSERIRRFQALIKQASGREFGISILTKSLRIHVDSEAHRRTLAQKPALLLKTVK